MTSVLQQRGPGKARRAYDESASSKPGCLDKLDVAGEGAFSESSASLFYRKQDTLGQAALPGSSQCCYKQRYCLLAAKLALPKAACQCTSGKNAFCVILVTDEFRSVFHFLRVCLRSHANGCGVPYVLARDFPVNSFKPLIVEPQVLGHRVHMCFSFVLEGSAPTFFTNTPPGVDF